MSHLSRARPLIVEAKALFRLGLPIVVSLSAATLIGVVDTIMIAPLGTVPLAAASITASVLIILYSGLYGFVSVIGVRMAEAFGMEDSAALSDATGTGLIVSLIAGLSGTALMLALLPFLPLLGQPENVIAALGGYWVAVSFLLVPFTMFYTLKALFDAMNRPWLGVALAFLAVIVNVPANLLLIHGVGAWQGFGLLGAGLASLLSESLSLMLAVVLSV